MCKVHTTTYTCTHTLTVCLSKCHGTFTYPGHASHTNSTRTKENTPRPACHGTTSIDLHSRIPCGTCERMKAEEALQVAAAKRVEMTVGSAEWVAFEERYGRELFLLHQSCPRQLWRLGAKQNEGNKLRTRDESLLRREVVPEDVVEKGEEGMVVTGWAIAEADGAIGQGGEAGAWTQVDGPDAGWWDESRGWKTMEEDIAETERLRVEIVEGPDPPGYYKETAVEDLEDVCGSTTEEMLDGEEDDATFSISVNDTTGEGEASAPRMTAADDTTAPKSDVTRTMDNSSMPGATTFGVDESMSVPRPESAASFLIQRRTPSGFRNRTPSERKSLEHFRCVRNWLAVSS